MARIAFSDDLLTGHPDVDRQHRALFQVAEALLRLEEPGVEILGKVFRFLESYVRVHFAAEERAMVEMAWPRLEHHRKQHRLFLMRVREIRQAQEGGEPLASLHARLHVLFEDWFVQHIQAVDRPMAEALRAAEAASGKPQELPSVKKLVEQGDLPRSTLRLKEVHWEGDGVPWDERWSRRPPARRS